MLQIPLKAKEVWIDFKIFLIEHFSVKTFGYISLVRYRKRDLSHPVAASANWFTESAAFLSALVVHFRVPFPPETGFQCSPVMQRKVCNIGEVSLHRWSVKLTELKLRVRFCKMDICVLCKSKLSA